MKPSEVSISLSLLTCLSASFLYPLIEAKEVIHLLQSASYMIPQAASILITMGFFYRQEPLFPQLRSLGNGREKTERPVKAINFKSGSHARLQFPEERGCGP